MMTYNDLLKAMTPRNYSDWEDNTTERTTEEILDDIDIKDIEKYLRKKKLENLNKNERRKI